jgi:hypothetical protein
VTADYGGNVKLVNAITGVTIWTAQPGSDCASAYQCLSIQTRPR